ncbi:WD40 repeat domain-containing protein [Sphaerisporangium corydalis]|uniref:WD40 repeat domain-containing protein n=1 Tax=Sphaerisporangium corydalis TaxID=1441875 RepID=A0ABV9ECZ5_9ACTN|nr:hypothetical protein [Sphaerisporangium corydalis]
MRFTAVGALVLVLGVTTALPASGTTTTPRTTQLAQLTRLGHSATTVPAAHTAHTAHKTLAGHETHAGAVRYASLRSCTVKKETAPCGPWRLNLHDGTRSTLPGARVHARDAHGKVLKDVPAPIAVSGDGRSIAYIRDRDDRLVVRELTGKVHTMPGSALPKATDGLTFDLSLTGGVLAVEDGDEKWVRLFDVAAGKALGTLPAHHAFAGFSGDEDEVLATMGSDENTTLLVTYDLEGNELTSRVPPQVVASNTPATLSADGRTVAFYSPGTRTLKFYDLESDTVVGGVRVKLPGGGTTPEMLDWTGAHEVTAHVLHGETSTTMTVLRIDTGTGAVKVRDSYKIKNAFTFAACGG